MSVSTSVMGIREPDGKLAQMADLALRCLEMDISVPEEVEAYFKGTDALAYGADRERIIREATEVSLKYDLRHIEGLCGGDVEYGEGMVIDLSKLPEDITKLRVYMS